MVTETQEIVMGSKDLTHIIKGKRTKRQSPVSPLRLAVTSTSSCGGESGGERERMNRSTIDFADSSTGGEEDMANCLILLAQGSHKTSANLYSPAAKSSSAGSYVYRCKTCNRCFPSFQALGGHRASHKKSNNNKVGNEGKKGIIVEYDDVNNTASTALSLKISNRSFYGGSNINANITNVKSNKVHECSICGAEFSSGQALGGHMRRHRAVFSSSTSTTPTLSVTPAMSVVASCSPDQSQESKKPRNSLRLDLNLPAPEDDVRESQFHFPSKEQVLVFSASSLVDCHY